MALTSGTRLGPYEITAQLGRGGMGEVYRATDTNLKRQVAIKVLPESLAGDAERLARFQREAEVLASLNHPNIAAIYGLERAEGQTALVMELVEGPTLADSIAQGLIPVDEALPVAKQIAEALEAAHEQGIIHRDLKPANVKVRPDGTVKVLDFGLAKAMEPTGTMSPSASQSPTITTPAMTQAGMILGTAAYMSPEQAKGRRADKRSDVWAFGCVLYEMLTGRRAFDRDDVAETLADVMRVEPAWDRLPEGLSLSLLTYLKRSLHKDPRQRIPDIADMRLALEGAFETAAPQVTGAVAVSQPGWRQFVPVAASASVVALLVAGLAAWMLWPTSEPGVVSRFDYDLPQGQAFRATGRNVIALSPDGRAFVYNTLSGLYLRTVGELDARLMAGTEPAAVSPFFSPDGNAVAYFDPRAGQLKRVATSGGAPVVITEIATNVFGATWGPDGTILFGQEDGIHRVPATGGTSGLIIPVTEGEFVYGPQLLPDGDSVLFSVNEVGDWDQSQIVVQTLATGERTVLVEGGNDARYVPTGHLVYALGEGLFAVAFDPESVTVSGAAVPLVQGVMRAAGTQTGAANYGISQNGTLVYVRGESISGESVLARVDPMGAVELFDVPPMLYRQPRVSPDGREVVVEAVETETTQVWVYELDGTSVIRPLTREGNNFRPVWGPDDGQVTFSSDREGPASLYLRAANGQGVAERLTTAEAGTEHYAGSWSPDGRTLALTIVGDGGPGVNADLWTLSRDEGNELRPFATDPDDPERLPEFSPDGNWIAYSAGFGGEGLAVYVQPFPATGAVYRISSPGAGAHPGWWPDGSALFFRSPGVFEGQFRSLLMARVNTTNGVTFGPIQPLPVERMLSYNDYRDYDITPDGSFVVTVPVAAATAAEAPQVVIVQNFFTELERLAPTQ